MTESNFKFTRVRGTPVTDDEILADLKRVAALIGQETVSQPSYKLHGAYDDRTVSRRLGTWNKALTLAGLKISIEKNISDDRLFENLLNLWQILGRQPRRRDLTIPQSAFSQSPYTRRFGSWTKTIESFVAFANASETENKCLEKLSPTLKPGRDPSLRLRYHVLKRDCFKCKQCGASPATRSDVKLHIDHIIPWSKGGLTNLENLQTLCLECNLGKSDCS